MTKQEDFSHDPGSGRHPRPRRRSLDRHARRCTVCRHPDREAIEDAFLHWDSPETIARAFGIADHSSIYRHAHANGLFSRRTAHYHSRLEKIIEHAAGNIKVTGKDVINAIRAVSCLTDDGKWIEPIREIIYTTESVSKPASNTSPPPAAPQNPNSQPGRLEHASSL